MKKLPQIIDAALMDKLLQQPDIKTKKGIRDKAMLELMYATGMKVSELIHIKVSDVNLTGRYVTCHAAPKHSVTD
jgi:integrase/recombinase XerD